MITFYTSIPNELLNDEIKLLIRLDYMDIVAVNFINSRAQDNR